MSEFKDLCPLNRRPCLQNKALLRKHLVAFGVNCTMSTHATDEALIMLRRESFSIVFLDEMAGPLKPLQFLKMLRGDLNTSDVTIPVVLVSSGVDAARIATATRA